MSNGAEVRGGGPHDGIHFDVPVGVKAVVFISEFPDGEYQASLNVRRGWEMVDARTADCLLQLAENMLQNSPFD